MMKTKKGKVELSAVIVLVILVGMVTLGSISFLFEQATSQGITGVDYGFNGTFNHMEQISNTTEQVRNQLQNSNLISAQGFAALFSGAFAILRVVLNVAFLPITILTDLATALGLPYWVSLGLTSLIILIIVFSIMNIVFGRGRA